MADRDNTPAHLDSHIQHAGGQWKTVCTSAVLAHFGIAPSEYHYSGSWGDVERILRRKGFAVRSRLSRFPKRCTVGQARARIAKISEPGQMFYVGVPGHAMLLDGAGRTVVDTAPRKRDRRQVHRVCAVFSR